MSLKTTASTRAGARTSFPGVGVLRNFWRASNSPLLMAKGPGYTSARDLARMIENPGQLLQWRSVESYLPALARQRAGSGQKPCTKRRTTKKKTYLALLH